MISDKSSIATWLKDILACPVCKSDVALDDINELICTNSRCRLRFPIIDGVPIMLAQLNRNHKYEKQFFDQEFSDYASYKLENWRISYIRRIFSSLCLDTAVEDYYLDIGVGGSGYTVIEGARRRNKSVGLDLSIEGIKKAQYFARLELGERSNLCGFVVGLAENLPFKDNAFNKLSSIAVLEHIPEDNQAIAEIARVVKPQGKIFITVPNAFKRLAPIFWLHHYIWDKRVGHLRHYLAEDINAEFERHRFVSVDTFYSGHIIKLLQILIARFALESSLSKIWWQVEEIDLSMRKMAHGTQLHLSMNKRK